MQLVSDFDIRISNFSAPTTPPKNEAKSDMAMARPASPRRAIG